MIDESHLPYFITEDIYLVKEEKATPASEPSSAEEPMAKEPKPAASYDSKPEPPATHTQVAEPAPTVHELAIWTPPLTAPDKELLVKILAAIKKDFNKAHLMEGINAYQPHYKELLCFGYQKELELKLGKAVDAYQPTQIESRKILISVSPADLQADPLQKKHLWEALQKMFL